jgi:hypothetical protein
VTSKGQRGSIKPLICPALDFCITKIPSALSCAVARDGIQGTRSRRFPTSHLVGGLDRSRNDPQVVASKAVLRANLPSPAHTKARPVFAPVGIFRLAVKRKPQQAFQRGSQAKRDDPAT